MAIATWKTGWRLWGTSLWNFCGAQQARLDAYVTVIRWSLHWCKLALFTAFMKWYRFPRFSVTLYRKKKEQASSLFTASTICKEKKITISLEVFCKLKGTKYAPIPFTAAEIVLFDCEEKQRDHVFWNKPVDMLCLFSDYFGRSWLILMIFSNSNIMTIPSVSWNPVTEIKVSKETVICIWYASAIGKKEQESYGDKDGSLHSH